jgi:sugar lactone lactonase YvrE
MSEVEIGHWACVIEAQAELGEGPHWNIARQQLEWIDIVRLAVHSWQPTKQLHKTYSMPERIGAIVPRQLGGYVAVTQSGYQLVDLAKGKLSPLATPHDIGQCRFNDAKCDAKGRFWAGTLPLNKAKGQAALYCLDIDGTLRKVLSGLDVSNGMGWNNDCSLMYLTDSGKRTIYVFDFAVDKGTLSNQRVFAQLTESEGVPDGLAVDQKGGVWSAIWDGWRIVRFDRYGRVDRILNLPIPRPTSCAFGGDNLSTLYVTSARYHLTKEILDKAPLSGAIFSVETNVRGVSVAKFGG